jgi:hypothetical protein
MSGSISSTGHDEVVPFPLGLAGDVDQMIGAFRELKMEGDAAFQELLAKEGKDFSPFPTPGIGIHDDLYFSGNSVKQQNPPLRQI